MQVPPPQSLATLVEAFDWASTPLGPRERWPASLVTFERLCIESRFPIILFWGPDLVQIYNDAYRPILADRHPLSLGQCAKECWFDIWDDAIGPMLNGVLERAESTWSENLLLPIQRDGVPQERYFTFSYSPARDGGKVVGVFCAVQETTEIVRAAREAAERNAALAEIDRAKTSFYNNVSHELRTPLTLMLGPAVDRMREGTTDDGLRRDLEVIVRNGRRLLRLVNTLLDFSRIEANRLALAPSAVNIGELTRDLASMFQSAMESAGITFTIDAPDDLGDVMIDTRLWEHVVYNLLSNALKYTFAGEVVCSVRAAGDQVRLVVRDTGVGLAPEDAAHVFERFWRASGQPARSHEGSGIGLAFVAEIARIHDGTVAFESERGAGSMVTFAIPLIPAGARNPVEQAVPQAADQYVADVDGWMTSAPNTTPALRTGSPRVLIVDDNADLRAYMTRVLGEFYDVVAADGGMSGVEIARTMLPDIILCDIMMPDIDGLAFITAIRGNPELVATPVLFVSARAEDGVAEAGLKAGADGYLLKPFSSHELLVRVDRELTRRRLREAESQRFRTIAQAVPQIVWTADSQGRLSFLNARFEQFTGVSLDEALQHGWMRVVPAEEHALILDHFARGDASGTPIEFEHHLWHEPTGTFRSVLVQANPSRDAASNITGWVGTLTDVDEARRARDRDHRASEAFQLASLPKSLPRVAGVRFSAEYHAAEAESLVGGDWYDAFELTDGRIVISVGDVMGSGLDSAVTMAAARQAIRGAAQIYPDPHAVLDAADRALHSEQPDRIVTAFVGVFEPITGYFMYASAGHPPPLLRRADGTIVELNDSSLPLGLRTEAMTHRETARTVHLAPGALLVLYTDGLTEATRDTTVGESRLRSALADAMPSRDENIARYLRRAVLDEGPSDDVAILTLAVVERPADDTHRWTVPATDAALVVRLRREAVALLREYGANDAEASDAELILGELLGNVVRHTRGDLEVVLDLAGEYPVAHVLDRGSGFTFMARLPQDDLSESGRGLFISAMLARDLSVVRRPDGGSHARAVLPCRRRTVARVDV